MGWGWLIFICSAAVAIYALGYSDGRLHEQEKYFERFDELIEMLPGTKERKE